MTSQHSQPIIELRPMSESALHETHSPKSTVHWRAPTTIIVSFLVAFATAVSHHVAYSYLDQTKVSDNIRIQQGIGAAGIALAFFFRASLTIGLVTTYYQSFWWSVRRHTLDFANIDSLAGFISSISDLVNYRAIAFSPALALLALLIWLIPLASIIPPSTLSIGQTTVTSTSLEYPYTIDYHAETLAKYSNGYVMNEISSQTWYDTAFSWYGQPSGQLLRTTTATAMQGSVPQVQGDHANATYTVEFNGPSVRCQKMDSEVMKGWDIPLRCDSRAASTNLSRSCQRYFNHNRSLETNRVTYMYIGWLPDGDNVIPFDDKDKGLTGAGLPDTRGSLGSYRGGPVSIFVASRVKMQSDKWRALNCSFFNATITADFAFDGRKRAVPLIRNVRHIHPIVASIESPWHADQPLGYKNAVLFNYMAVMQCLCDILYGMVYTPVATDSPMANDASQWGPRLGRTALGLTQEITPLMLTALHRTAINDTDWTFPAEQPQYPLNATDEQRFSMAYPTTFFKSASFGRPLGEAIEDLFYNMTLSLFSETNYLRRDSKSVEMLTSRDQIIYVYEHRRLLFAYGIALAVALVASIGGLLSIAKNRMTYNNRISTHVRTIVPPKLGYPDWVIDESGADPLSESMAKSIVRWRSVHGSLLGGHEHGG